MTTSLMPAPVATPALKFIGFRLQADGDLAFTFEPADQDGARDRATTRANTLIRTAARQHLTGSGGAVANGRAAVQAADRQFRAAERAVAQAELALSTELDSACNSLDRINTLRAAVDQAEQALVSARQGRNAVAERHARSVTAIRENVPAVVDSVTGIVNEYFERHVAAAKERLTAIAGALARGTVVPAGALPAAVMEWLELTSASTMVKYSVREITAEEVAAMIDGAERGPGWRSAIDPA